MVDWKNWIFKKGVELFSYFDIEPGDKIIEFGSGRGDYSLPAAVLIGEQDEDGSIISIDEDDYDLKQLKERANGLGITNIKTENTDGKLTINAEKEIVDGVLVFDVLHYFNSHERAKLYEEIFRVLKKNGVFITFPNHYKHSYPLWNLSNMTLEDVIEEIESHHFKFQKKWQGKLIHDHNWYNGVVLSFKKEIK